MLLPQHLAPSLTAIEWGGYGSPIDPAWQFPAALTSLHLTYWCPPAGSVALRLPQGLTELDVSAHERADELQLPASLTSLRLSLAVADRMRWPPQLQSVEFALCIGGGMDGSLQRWAPPSSLTSLEIRRWNVPLAGLPLPAGLRSLLLINNFNDPLTGVLFPPALTHLHLGVGFNQPLVGVRFPPTLTHLNLGRKFNHSLGADVWEPPPHLESLTIAGGWNQPLEQLHLPPTLLRLSFFVGEDFDQPLELLASALPAGLQELTLRFSLKLKNRDFPHLNLFPLPPALRCLKLGHLSAPSWALLRLPTAAQLPASMREVHVAVKRKEERAIWRRWAAEAFTPSCALLLHKDGDAFGW